MEDKGLQAQCPPQQRDVWESLPVSGELHPQCGVGLVLGLALAAGWEGSALGDGGSWLGWGHAPPAPHTHPVISAIYSEVYFLYQMPSPLGRS